MQPNILFIPVDQLAAQFLRCYGDSICHASNIDRLAAEGTVFETAYCDFPLCSASRDSMATGKLCSEIGAYDNSAELPASIPLMHNTCAQQGIRQHFRARCTSSDRTSIMAASGA